MLGPNKIMSLFGHVITKMENGRGLEGTTQFKRVFVNIGPDYIF